MSVLSYTPLAPVGQGAVALAFLAFSSLKIDHKGSNPNRIDHTEALNPLPNGILRTNDARVKAHEISWGFFPIIRVVPRPLGPGVACAAVHTGWRGRRGRRGVLVPRAIPSFAPDSEGPKR